MSERSVSMGVKSSGSTTSTSGAAASSWEHCSGEAEVSLLHTHTPPAVIADGDLLDHSTNGKDMPLMPIVAMGPVAGTELASEVQVKGGSTTISDSRIPDGGIQGNTNTAPLVRQIAECGKGRTNGVAGLLDQLTQLLVGDCTAVCDILQCHMALLAGATSVQRDAVLTACVFADELSHGVRHHLSYADWTSSTLFDGEMEGAVLEFLEATDQMVQVESTNQLASAKGVKSEAETTLHISGFFALTGKHSSWAMGLLPATLLAVEHINQRPYILPGYQLELVVNDTVGDGGKAIRELIHHIEKPPTKLMIIGSARSIENIVLAETAKWWNLVQVGYTATYPDLSDRERFPLFFRTRMAQTAFTDARIRLMEEFGWDRVAVLHQDMQKFNTTKDEFLAEYANISSTLGYQESKYSALAYDAMWAIALALDASIGSLPGNKSLEDFSYEDSDFSSVFVQKMGELQFEGMSGPVIFTDTGDRRGLVIVNQIADGELHVHGSFDPVTYQYIWNTDMNWPGGSIPRDEGFVKVKEIVLSPVIFYVTGAFVACGILMAFYFLLFNITNRKTKLIKMSSPNMNNVIVLGGILVYISALLYGMDGVFSNDSVDCMLRTWVLCIGFTTGFGAMFSKTWRIHKIFTNKKVKTIRIMDIHLFGVIVVLLVIDIIILTLWTALDPPTINVQFYPNVPAENEVDTIYTPMSKECRSVYDAVWTTILFGYKGIIIVFGVFLAWETRKVNYPQLNDSRHIGFAVYNVTIMCCVSVPTSMFLSPQQKDLQFILIALCLVFCSMMTLCIVFIPKLQEHRISHRTVNDYQSNFTVPKTTQPTQDTSLVYHSSGSCAKAEEEILRLRKMCNLSTPPDPYIVVAQKECTVSKHK
ncbi:gamma-aminobutyric acid type B receptor subunit 2-like [Saccoglossus kowalevskii]